MKKVLDAVKSVNDEICRCSDDEVNEDNFRLLVTKPERFKKVGDLILR